MNARAQLDRFTIDDLERVPDDGMRYEVFNGRLLITPSAPYQHNRRSQHLELALLSAAPSGLESPGNRSNDTVTKLERYARAGIGHYWIADPHRITVYRLDPGEAAYREVTAGRRVRVTEPFPVEVSLANQALPG